MVIRVGIRGAAVPQIFRALAPKLTEKDRRAVDSISKLLSFLIGDNTSQPGGYGLSANGLTGILSNARNPENRKKLAALLPVLREFAPNMRVFGLQIASRLAEKSTARVLRASADAIFGPATPVPSSSSVSTLGSLASKNIVGGKTNSNSNSAVGGYGYRA